MTGALPTEQTTPVAASKPRTPASKASTGTRATRGSTRLSATKSSPAVAQKQTDAPVQTDNLDLYEEGDTSGYGDLTFSSLNEESPAHGTRPPSAVKVGATPAHETSILALANFKRRPRQPSLLRMVQQTTDVEDNDESGLSNTDNLDFDDFVPQDESTPINKQRTTTTEKEGANDSGAHLSSSGSRGRKRKLTPVIQVPRSSPPYDPPSGADVESLRWPSPSLPDVLPSREEVVEQTQEDSEILSQTLAPPMSSSPVHEVSKPKPAPEQTRSRRGGRTGKQMTYNEDSAEETETPAKQKRNDKAKAQHGISTAQLKSLLPRRRNRVRARDEYDLTSSEDVTQFDSDQDELQMPSRRARQRPGASKVTTSPKATKKTTRGKKATAPPTKAANKASRTYGRRRVSSDKENDATTESVEEATEPSAVEVSDKLAAIRKKFEEIDDFELEFATVDDVTSSSPYR